MKQKLRLQQFSNSTEVIAENRRFMIIKPVTNVETNELHKNNLIVIKSLTKHTGIEPGAKSSLIRNDRVKKTIIGLSDEALFELHLTLAKHFEKD